VSSEDSRKTSLLLKSLQNDEIFHQIILVSAIILAITLILHDWPIASIASLTLFGLTLVVLVIRSPAFFLNYFYYYFASIANLVGVLVCEFGGIALSELGDLKSHFVGSLPAIVFAWWLFFIILEWASHGRLRNKPKHFASFRENGCIVASMEKSVEKIINIIISWWLETGIRWAELAIPLSYLAVYSVVFVHVFPYPAFLLNLDRFQYANIHPLGIGASAMTIASYLLPLLLVQIYRGKKRKLCLIGIIISMIVYLWIGNKFGIFLNLVIYICLVVGIAGNEQLGTSNMRRFVLVAIGIFAVVSISAVVIQTVFLSPDSDSLTYIENRVSQQGQLWWNVFREQGDESPHVDELSHEVEVWFSNKSDKELNYDYGVYKMMKISAPTKVVASKIESGSRYTEAGFASAYYYGGYFGIAAFSVVMALVSSLCVRLLLKVVTEYRVVEAIILCRFYGILRTSLSMFTFNDLFSVESLFSLMVLIIVLLCWRRAGVRHVEAQM
jgi:hypothetical protein